MKASRLLLACLVLVTAPAAFPLDADRKGYSLTVEHDTGCRRVGRSSCLPLRETEALALKPGDEISVVLLHPNPFFYKYEVTKGKATDSPDLSAVAKFSTETVASALGTLKAMVAKVALADDQVNEALANQFKTFTTNDARKRFVGELRASNPQGEIEIALKKRFGADPQEYLPALTARLESLGAIVKEIPGWMKRSLDPKLMAEIRKEVSNKNWAEVELLPKDIERIRLANGDITRILGQSNLGLGDALQDLLLQLQFVARELDAQEVVWVAALSFNETLRSMKDELSLGSIVPSPELKDQPYTLSIHENPANKKLLSQAAPAEKLRKTGDFTFTLRAYNPFVMGVGASVVYVFVNGADGKNLAQRSAMMLSLTPRSLAVGTFEPSLQIGATPEKDALGIYVGLNARLYRRLGMGMGWTWQQIKPDAEGKDRYKGGFYVHATVVP